MAEIANTSMEQPVEQSRTVKTYKVRRDQIVDGNYRSYGQLVPEAHTWRIVESYLRAGEIEDVEVSEEEFRAAIEEFCPQIAGQVLLAAGLEENTYITGAAGMVVARDPEPDSAQVSQDPGQPVFVEQTPEPPPAVPASTKAPAKKAPAKRTNRRKR